MLSRHKKPLLRRTMKQKRKPNPVMLKKLAIAFAITIIAVFCYIKLQPHTLEAKQQIQLEHKSQQLKSTQTDLEQIKVRDADTQKKLDETNKQLQETQKQLEAKRNTATAYAAELPPTPKVTYAVPEDVAKAYIYSHESGNNPGSINGSSGACGLGQALPCSKMPCSLTDYACQDSYFTQYMQARYGTWANAQAFWQANHWW